MILIVVPIAMPIARALGQDMIMSGANVADCPISAAGLELADTIDTLALHFSDPVGLDRTAVLEVGKTVAVATTECPRRKLPRNDRTVSVRKVPTLRKRIRPYAHAR